MNPVQWSYFFSLLIPSVYGSTVLTEESKNPGTGNQFSKQSFSAVPFVTNAEHEFMDYNMESVFSQSSLPSKPLYLTIPFSAFDVRLELHPLAGVQNTGPVLQPDLPEEMESSFLLPARVYEGTTLVQNYDGSRRGIAVITWAAGLYGVFDTAGYRYAIEPLEPKSVNSTVYPHTVRPMGPVQNQDGGTSYGTSQRRKRSTVDSKYLELMIVTEDEVVDFHGQMGYTKYIQSLVNIMNVVYHHSSLDVTLEVILVKILVLDQTTAERIIVPHDAFATLSRFCHWMAEAYIRDDADPQHFDMALLLIRREFGHVGYAPVDGMCQPGKSCGVIKDEGFSSAFVAAHEVAHVMGVHHDGEKTSSQCRSDPSLGFIMAPLMFSTVDRFQWSSCSRSELTRLLRKHTCLNDKPEDINISINKSLALGSQYSLDEQCRKEFGDKYSLCNNNRYRYNPCQNLWCGKRGTVCKTKKTPPLPGTQCGDDKWCYDGVCTSHSSLTYHGFHIVPVHGTWSAWSQWSDCSKSCGQGLTQRSRQCSGLRPLAKGKDCEGSAYDFKACSSKPCLSALDYREIYCAGFRWGTQPPLPYISDNNERRGPCTVRCKIPSRRSPMRNSIVVETGTRCSYDTPHEMCFKGKCLKFGCDGLFNSSATEDECGVCQGDSTFCSTRQTILDETFYPPGFSVALRLPKGARDVVVQKKKDYLFLGLRNIDSDSLLLNPQRYRHPNNLVNYGVLWVYGISARELLTAKGPLLADYAVLVYTFHGGVTSVRASYRMPISTTVETSEIGEMQEARFGMSTVTGGKPLSVLYRWEHHEWSGCSRSCGSGVSEATYQCVEVGSTFIVDDTHCSISRAPRRMRRRCNNYRCGTYNRNRRHSNALRKAMFSRNIPVVSPLRARHVWIGYWKWWKASAWSKCSASCGAIGVTKRAVTCHMWYGTRSGSPTTEKPCQVEGLKPDQVRPCNRAPCLGIWKVGTWTKCSNVCGNQTRSRSVTCGRNDVDANCNISDRPRDTRLCKVYSRCITGHGSTVKTVANVSKNLCAGTSCENPSGKVKVDNPKKLKDTKERMCERDKLKLCVYLSIEKCKARIYQLVCCIKCKTA